MKKNIYNPKIHHRKSIRLKGYDYTSEGAYFVTICVKNRECLFGEVIDGEMILSDIGKIVYQNWYDIPNHFKNIDIDEFIVMPNHIHGIIFINSENDIDEKNNEIDNQINVGAFHEIHNPNIDSNKNIINESINVGAFHETPQNETLTDINKPVVNKFESNDYNIIVTHNNRAFHETPLRNLPPPKNEHYSKLSPSKKSLPVIIRLFKQSVTIWCRKNNHEYFQWQRNYHEWIIRNEKMLNNVRQYIINNPIKWKTDRQNPINEYYEINNNNSPKEPL